MENRIRELRKAHKVTQARMASDLGVAISTVQNWESDRTDMTGYTLLMIADYFGVTPSEVYGSGIPDASRIEEGELLADYRASSPKGRAQIREYAAMVAERHPKSAADEATGAA